MLLGAFLIAIGAYLCVIKAGLPYQDPTLEMQIKWSAYHTAGIYNLYCGAFVELAALICAICKRIFKRKN